ncbi:MAG: hypothetical protein ACJAV5_000248 [Vicingaceae bacterium]
MLVVDNLVVDQFYFNHLSRFRYFSNFNVLPSGSKSSKKVREPDIAYSFLPLLDICNSKSAFVFLQEKNSKETVVTTKIALENIRIVIK